MSHDKADARARLQALVNLELDRYRRRLKQVGEDFISMQHDECVARGLPFDHVTVSDEAFTKACQTYIAAELVAGDAAEPA